MKRQLKIYGFVFATISMLAAGPAQAVEKPLLAAASIKPIHSILSAVMKGAGPPGLIVSGAASPHSFHLRPSESRAIRDAALLVWVGPSLETFLDKPIQSLRKGKGVLTLSKAHGLVRYEFRSGHDHNDHGHGHGKKGDHDHDHKDDHGKKGEHDHDHDRKHAKEHKDAHGHSHDHGDLTEDPHYWLDPENAVVFARAMAEALAQIDKKNAALFAKNAKAFEKDIRLLRARLAGELAPVSQVEFVVFHAAYQYFEKRFGLRPAHVIAINPETSPGARQVSEVARTIAGEKIRCIFSEPQFSPKLVKILAAKSGAKAGVIDPLGADLPAGSKLYPSLLSNMARSIRKCHEK